MQEKTIDKKKKSCYHNKTLKAARPLLFEIMAVDKAIPQGGEAVLRFEDVSFSFGEQKPVLIESSFVVRRGLKLTLMGQNGAGKSTLF